MPAAMIDSIDSIDSIELFDFSFNESRCAGK
jgi:hypothetical protein